MVVAELAGGKENRMDSPRCQMTQQSCRTRLQSFLHSQISSCLFMPCSSFSPLSIWKNLLLESLGYLVAMAVGRLAKDFPCHPHGHQASLPLSGKKKKTAPVLLYNSLQLWETKQRKQQTQQPWGHFPLLTLTWWLRAWTLIPDRLEYIQALYDLCDPGQVA